MSQPPDTGVNPQPSPRGPWWREWRREEATLIVALVASIVAIVISVVTANSASSHSQADADRLNHEVDALRGSLQGLTKADVQRVQSDVQRVQGDVSSLRDSLQGVTRDEVQRMNNELGALRDSLQGVTRADIQRMNDELTSLQNSLQGMSKADDLQRVADDLRALRGSLQGLTRADLQRLETQVAAVGASVQGVSGESQGRAEELERRLRSAEEKFGPMQEDLQRLKNQADVAAKDLADAKGQYGQAVQVIDDFRVLARNLDAIITEKENELKGMVTDLEKNAGDFVLQQMPIGSIVLWPVAQNPPAKWRICDGQAVTAQEAPEFCELFKDTYWTSGEAKVVHVPDLRGYFVRGADTRKADDPEKVDEEAPREIGSKQRAKVPQHTHDVSDLRVAGGLWWQHDRNMLLYQSQRKEQLKGGEDLRTLAGGQGDWNTYQQQPAQTEVDAMALRGELGPMINEQGKVRPDNIALNFIIRVQR